MARLPLVPFAWRFATLARQQSPERLKVRPVLPFGEEGGRVHGGELLGHCGRHELIDADAFFPRQLFDRGLDGARKPQWVRRWC